MTGVRWVRLSAVASIMALAAMGVSTGLGGAVSAATPGSSGAAIPTLPSGVGSVAATSSPLAGATIVSGPPGLVPHTGVGSGPSPNFIIACDVGASTSWAVSNSYELVYSASMYCEIPPVEMIAKVCYEEYAPGHPGVGGEWGGPTACVADETYDTNIVLAANDTIVTGFEGKPTFYRAWGYLLIAVPPAGYTCGPCGSVVLGNEIYGP